MRARRRTNRAPTLLAAALALAGCNGAEDQSTPVAEREPLGLFTTLPVYWGETRDITAMLDEDSEAPWVRRVLEERYTLVPLDVLNPAALAQIEHLLLAQPRPLAPAENVALDSWVRNGGEVLILADPMLVQESLFAIGDKRRPQDVVLLSPILARWGLELRFDQAQDEAVRTILVDGFAIPVAMHGSLARLAPREGQGRCTLAAQGLVARCAIGKGRATVVADADLLDPRRESSATQGALSQLTNHAFAD